MPRNPTNNTEAHCYMLFKKDIETMKTNGWTPKEVFRLGIKSKEDNPQLISRIREQEEAINKLTKKVQTLARRNYELETKITQ